MCFDQIGFGGLECEAWVLMLVLITREFNQFFGQDETCSFAVWLLFMIFGARLGFLALLKMPACFNSFKSLIFESPILMDLYCFNLAIGLAIIIAFLLIWIYYSREMEEPIHFVQFQMQYSLISKHLNLNHFIY